MDNKLKMHIDAIKKMVSGGYCDMEDVVDALESDNMENDEDSAISSFDDVKEDSPMENMKRKMLGMSEEEEDKVDPRDMGEDDSEEEGSPADKKAMIIAILKKKKGMNA